MPQGWPHAIITPVERLRLPIIIILLSAIIAGAVIFILRQNISGTSVEILLPPPSSEITVYVSGEVQNPGMHVLPEESRLEDALAAAGGITSEADESCLNLARNLRDGDQVRVYRVGESSQLINLNTAEAWLLDALPGIGENTAQRIISYREENGPFETTDDLKKVKGIGESTFIKLEGMITVR